jgi:hypothetical protein
MMITSRSHVLSSTTGVPAAPGVVSASAVVLAAVSAGAASAE